MKIQKNFDIKAYNTFGVSIKTKFLVTISKPEDLEELTVFLQNNQTPFFFLGGGSNILFTKDFDGIIIKNELKGITIISENENSVEIEINAGEIWTDFVDFCVEKEWGGIENLVSIPGTIGGATVQNIGAYGSEFSSVINSVTAYNVYTGKIFVFNKRECDFSYRKSKFKTKEYSDLLIISVSVSLSKKPTLNTDYGSIKSDLEKQKISLPTIKDIRNIVASIRKEKLPDVNEIGSAGSFFKNPEVSLETAEKIKQSFPKIPIYPVNESTVKLSAGWMIDQCNLKGFRIGDAGVYEKQALVLVNHGAATTDDILQLIKKVQLSVKQKFDIDLLPEVVIV